MLLEPRLDGRVYERQFDGTECEWGRLTAWDPPNRVALTWHPGHGPDQAMLVDVTFRADGNATLVELTHSGWEILGDEAARIRSDYDGGWTHVLALFVGVA